MAGIAARVRDADPTLTAAGAREALASSARDFGAAGWDARYGDGLVDASAALSR